MIRKGLASIALNLPGFRGKERLYNLLDKIFNIFNRKIIVQRKGVYFSLDTNEIIQRRLMYEGGHQKELIDVCSNLMSIQESGVLYDVGANIGSVTLPLLQKHVNWSSYCFEPSPYPLLALHENLLLNENISDRCKVFSMGISDKSKVGEFYPSNERGNSGVGNLANTHNVFSNGIYTHLYRLDDIVDNDNFETPDIIKIDVEGFELEVLRGMSGLLEKKNDLAIVFEMEEYRLEKRKVKENEVFRLLGNNEFQIYSVGEERKIKPNEKVYGDFLALKGEFQEYYS